MADNDNTRMSEPSTSPSSLDSLPPVANIELTAPFRWLALGWTDFTKILFPGLAYGVALVGVSAILVWVLFTQNAADWVMVALAGFVFVAPMLAMGLYEAGRQLECGQRPSLVDMVCVKAGFRGDVALLGLALMLIYFLWGRVAQIVYGLSTTSFHTDPLAFLMFIATEPDGIRMGLVGTLIGGAIAFLAFTLVVVSAPMMLDRRTDVFVATVTSVRAVLSNFVPMVVWAGLIAVLTLIGIATALFGLAIVFPWLGLASWRAYRELVPGTGTKH